MPVCSSEAKRSYLERVLFFAVGLTLPFISFDTLSQKVAVVFWKRIAIVDIIVLILLFYLLIRVKLRINKFFLFYVIAVFLSLLVAFLRYGFDDLFFSLNIVSLFAVVMAACYWVIGLNAGNSRQTLVALLTGLVAGFFIEAVIVLHDHFFDPNWFSDLPYRLRGTFRKVGQLAAYSFGAAGIMLTVGWSILSDKKAKWASIVGGFLALFFVFITFRRVILVACIVWIVLFFLSALRYWRTKEYLTALLLMAITIAVCAMNINPWVESRARMLYTSYDVISTDLQNKFTALIQPEVQESATRLTDSRQSSALPGDATTPRPEAGSQDERRAPPSEPSDSTQPQPGDDSTKPQARKNRTNFVVMQYDQAIRYFWHYFPVGEGIGNARRLTVDFEFHNTFLALLVEMGIAGLVTFIALLARSIPFKKTTQVTRIKIVRLLVILFIVSSCVAMMHQTLYRDRTFLLFLGISSSVYFRSLIYNKNSNAEGQNELI